MHQYGRCERMRGGGENPPPSPAWSPHATSAEPRLSRCAPGSDPRCSASSSGWGGLQVPPAHIKVGARTVHVNRADGKSQEKCMRRAPETRTRQTGPQLKEVGTYLARGAANICPQVTLALGIRILHRESRIMTQLQMDHSHHSVLAQKTTKRTEQGKRGRSGRHLPCLRGCQQQSW